MTNCPNCGSDDLETRGALTNCIECGSYAINLGDRLEWVSARTAQRVRAAEHDAARRHEVLS